MQAGAEAAYLREQAARCRRLANAILNEDDVATLRKVAEDFEAKAAEIEGPEAPTMNGAPHPEIKPPGSEA